MSQNRDYSDYYKELGVDAKKQYNQKLNSIGKDTSDPYTFIPRPSITTATTIHMYLT